MKILLYGINFSPELAGVGKYSGEMARWLVEQGHEVRVVTAPPYYPDWKVWQGFSSYGYSRRVEDGVTVIRCPLYVPSRPTAIKRLLHLISFSVSSAFAIFAQFFWKPQLVILVVPTLFCAPQAWLLAKLTGATSVLHIQDYEVDALFGLSLAKGDRLKRCALAIERTILRAFVRVSTISSGMQQRALQKGVAEKRLRFFPNWSETARFQNIPRHAELLTRLGVDPRKSVVLYSGNIGDKQGLENVIEAAEQLRQRRDLVFLIVGDGAGKARLLDMVLQRGLTNVVFAPLQSYDDLPSLLASADCHLVIQKRGAADSVLPSKLTNILAVGGRALITTDPDTSLGLLCLEQPGIATMVEPESVEALIDGIKHTLSMPKGNTIGTDYAREFLDKDRILTRFLEEL
jgi:colanic acid biosynthesis glycosyl transferase WcaI